MKSTVLVALMGSLLFLHSTSFAATDSACMIRCTSQGSNYGYCQQLCSYGNNNAPAINTNPIVPQVNMQPLWNAINN